MTPYDKSPGLPGNTDFVEATTYSNTCVAGIFLMILGYIKWNYTRKIIIYEGVGKKLSKIYRDVWI